MVLEKGKMVTSGVQKKKKKKEIDEGREKMCEYHVEKKMGVWTEIFKRTYLSFSVVTKLFVK